MLTPQLDTAWVGDKKPAPDGRIMTGDVMNYLQALLHFRKAKSEGYSKAVILDIGRLPVGKIWDYVGDAINKSGSNPLRGLGPQLLEPFIDVTQLYSVPDNVKGLEIIALGDRYDSATMVNPACGWLHHLAIVAHAEKLRVMGIVLDAARLEDFDPGIIEAV